MSGSTKPARPLVQVPAGAPAWAAGLVRQVNDQLRLAVSACPAQPQRLYDAATASDLPPAADYPACAAYVVALQRIAVSNGSAWLRQNTGAAVA